VSRQVKFPSTRSH